MIITKIWFCQLIFAKTIFMCAFSLTGLSGDRFHFNSNGDGPARYNIIHFKQVQPGKYRWIKVGEYDEGELRLNMNGKLKLCSFFISIESLQSLYINTMYNTTHRSIGTKTHTRTQILIKLMLCVFGATLSYQYQTIFLDWRRENAPITSNIYSVRLQHVRVHKCWKRHLNNEDNVASKQAKRIENFNTIFVLCSAITLNIVKAYDASWYT